MKRKKKSQATEDVIRLRGCYEIALMGPNGEQLSYTKADNVVVTVGRKYVLSRIISQSPQTDMIGWIGVGTSTTAPATGDTLLGSEVTRLAIATFDVTNLTSNPPSWAAQVTFATNQANTTIGECGIFNASTTNAQTMLSHVTFSTINKTTSNTLAITYTISN